MKIVKFPYTEDSNGKFEYPDDPKLFKKVRVIKENGKKTVIAEYAGVGELEEHIPETVEKPYTKQDFMTDCQKIADKLFKK